MTPKIYKYLFRLAALSLIFSSCGGQVSTELSTKPVAPSKALTSGPKTGNSIVRDKTGNLWMTSYKNGVYRFDGKSLLNFSEKDRLSSRFVFSILEDNAGVLWFATADGITCYDGKAFSTIPITTIKERMVVYTKTKGDSLYDFPNHVENSVLSILQDSKGVIWLGTSDGIYLHDPAKKNIQGTRTFEPFVLNDSIKHGGDGLSIESILEDKTGNVWFGGRSTQGLYRYAPASGKLIHYSPDGDNWIRPFIQDRSGNVWFMRRRSSLYRYDGKEFTVFGEGQFSDWFLCMAEDRAGHLWFANGKKGGVTRYEPTSEKFTNITSRDGLCSPDVWGIYAETDGTIWFKDKDKVMCRYDGTSFSNFNK